MRFSQNQLLLYKLFLENEDRSFYMQEIGKILEKKPGVFQRTLNRLEDDGFVVSEFKANARFFKLNKQYSILEELKSIIHKIAGKEDIFTEKLLELEEELKSKRKTVKKKKETKKKNPIPEAKKIKKVQGVTLLDFQKGPFLSTLKPELSIPQDDEESIQEISESFPKKSGLMKKNQLELF